jgi:sirohydrochlorin cobaltochelatase
MTAPTTAPAMHGLILFAHGARDAQWAQPFEAVAARVRAQRPRQPVRLAYLELMTPSLGDAAAELCAAGCRTVSVLPLFLGQGGHLKRDLPQLVQRLHATHPEVRFVLRHAAGEHAALIAAMASVAVEALDAAAAPAAE